MKAEVSIRIVNLSTAERDAITSWVKGNVIFNTDINLQETYDGVKWISSTGLSYADVWAFNTLMNC